jgi:HlyD family secretion protein
MNRAKQNANRRENLFKEELISKDQVEIAQNQLIVATKHFEETKQNYQKLATGFRKEEVQKSLYSAQAQKANYLDLAQGTRPEKLAAEKQRLASSEAQLAELETKLAKLTVISPCNCELSEFEIEPGSLVLANQVMGTLINLNDLWVDAYLPQEVYGRVWPSDPVEIQSLTYPNKKFIGRVKFVGLKAEFTPRNIQTIEGRKQEVFKVKVSINNDQRLFRPGMDLDLRFNFRKEKV